MKKHSKESKKIEPPRLVEPREKEVVAQLSEAGYLGGLGIAFMGMGVAFTSSKLPTEPALLLIVVIESIAIIIAGFCALWISMTTYARLLPSKYSHSVFNRPEIIKWGYAIAAVILISMFINAILSVVYLSHIFSSADTAVQCLLPK